MTIVTEKKDFAIWTLTHVIVRPVLHNKTTIVFAITEKLYLMIIVARMQPLYGITKQKNVFAPKLRALPIKHATMARASHAMRRKRHPTVIVARIQPRYGTLKQTHASVPPILIHVRPVNFAMA